MLNLCKIPAVTHTHTPDRVLWSDLILTALGHHRYYEEQSSAEMTKALPTLISINMRRVPALQLWAHLDEGSDFFTASQNQHRRIQPMPAGKQTWTHITNTDASISLQSSGFASWQKYKSLDWNTGKRFISLALCGTKAKAGLFAGARASNGGDI